MTRTERLKREERATERRIKRQGLNTKGEPRPKELNFDEHRNEAPPPPPLQREQSQVERSIGLHALKFREQLRQGDAGGFEADIKDYGVPLDSPIVRAAILRAVRQ